MNERKLLTAGIGSFKPYVPKPRWYWKDGSVAVRSSWKSKDPQYVASMLAVESKLGTDYARIALDHFKTCSVSTVWIGLDHGWGSGKPLIFETLVMGGPLGHVMERYSTEEEAIAGHKEIVADVIEAYAQNTPWVRFRRWIGW